MSENEAASWSFKPGEAATPQHSAIRLLGGGDRFEAWLAWDDDLSAPVVLKLLRPDHTGSQRARRAISREAENLACLSHPAIVRRFSADLEGDRPWIALEFLDGPRLSTLVRRFGPLTHEQVVPLGLEIGSALSYMHRQGRLHLDVKPQNLIMGAPPRLIDLSIARKVEEMPEISGPLGTDAYMAPEQCFDGHLDAVGTWSDVWGFGATLYEAVNGYRPFRRRAEHEAHPQLSEDPAGFHPRVPEPLRAIITVALRRDPSSRPSIDELMLRFDELAPEAREVALRRLRRRVR